MRVLGRESLESLEQFQPMRVLGRQSLEQFQPMRGLGRQLLEQFQPISLSQTIFRTKKIKQEQKLYPCRGYIPRMRKWSYQEFPHTLSLISYKFVILQREHGAVNDPLSLSLISHKFVHCCREVPRMGIWSCQRPPFSKPDITQICTAAERYHG